MTSCETSWNTGLLTFFQQYPCSLLVTSMREGFAVVVQPNPASCIEVLSYDLEAAGGVTEYQGKLCISSNNGYYSFLTHELGSEILHQVKSKHFFGVIQPHELHALDEVIWVGNTGFNCIAEVNESSSFKPYWFPPFIDPNDSIGDRCHLNGFAICPIKKKPEYATVFCRSSQQRGWRHEEIDEGCVYQLSNNTVISEGLIRPHSPRLHEGSLYVLESGTGKLIAIDLQSHQSRVVHQAQGFVRGLHLIGETAIIGISAFRETFHNLPNADPNLKASLVFVNITTGEETARLCFKDRLSEFFSVTALTASAGKQKRHLFDMGTGRYVSIGRDLPWEL